MRPIEEVAQAITWQAENPTTTLQASAIIHNVNPNTLKSRLRRARCAASKTPQGGHNRILSDTQIVALQRYIRDMYESGLGATNSIVFSAIQHLKACEQPPKPPPSQRWFQGFLRDNQNLFKRVKTKRIARNRVSAQDLESVSRWFDNYIQTVQTLDCGRDDILNFDEAGFQIGMCNGEDVIIPADITEALYTAGFENRRSITLIETIIANGCNIPAYLIIQGRRHMMNWTRELTDKKTRFNISDSGFINSEIAIDYLTHLIEHTNAGPESKWKILLMDGHSSHLQPEFLKKANNAHIRPLCFPGHLTHILQPLDVGVFQPYKHWHQKAVQYAIRNLDLEYTVSSFVRDLDGIRKATFKSTTVWNSFRNSGMWPIDLQCALKKMKIYQPPEPQVEYDFPQPGSRAPQKFYEAEKGIEHWDQELQSRKEEGRLLSSPTLKAYSDFTRGTRELLSSSNLQSLQLTQLTIRISNQTKARIQGKNRKSLQSGGGITGEEADLIKIEKDRKEKARVEKRKAFIVRVAKSKVKKDLHRRGIDARKDEKARKKQVEELLKQGQFVPIELWEVIPDPEKLITTEEFDLQVQEILISKPGFSGWNPDEEKDEFIEEDIDLEGVFGPTWESITQQDEISLNCSWDRDSLPEDEEFDIIT